MSNAGPITSYFILSGHELYSCWLAHEVHSVWHLCYGKMTGQVCTELHWPFISFIVTVATNQCIFLDIYILCHVSYNWGVHTWSIFKFGQVALGSRPTFLLTLFSNISRVISCHEKPADGCVDGSKVSVGPIKQDLTWICVELWGARSKTRLRLLNHC